MGVPKFQKEAGGRLVDAYGIIATMEVDSSKGFLPARHGRRRTRRKGFIGRVGRLVR